MSYNNPPTGHYSAGLNHVGAYQVSGRPFFKSELLPVQPDTSVRIEFPNVTKRVVIKTASSHSVRVHFVPWATGEFGFTADASTNDNYFVIDNLMPVEFDVKCKEIFLSSASGGGQNDTITVFAELTNIPASRMFDLEGLEGVSQ